MPKKWLKLQMQLHSVLHANFVASGMKLKKKNKDEIHCHNLHGNNNKYLMTTYKLQCAFFLAYICKDMVYRERQVYGIFMSVHMPP